MKTINEYIQKKHVSLQDNEISNYDDLVEGNYYTLKQFAGDYSIFQFESFSRDNKGYYELYYTELLSVSDDWNNGQMYFKSKNDGCNFLTIRDSHAKVYAATDEEIKELEQARK